jgi:hypothetical protein
MPRARASTGAADRRRASRSPKPGFVSSKVPIGTRSCVSPFLRNRTSPDVSGGVPASLLRSPACRFQVNHVPQPLPFLRNPPFSADLRLGRSRRCAQRPTRPCIGGCRARRSGSCARLVCPIISRCFRKYPNRYSQARGQSSPAPRARSAFARTRFDASQSDWIGGLRKRRACRVLAESSASIFAFHARTWRQRFITARDELAACIRRRTKPCRRLDGVRNILAPYSTSQRRRARGALHGGAARPPSATMDSDVFRVRGSRKYGL